MSNTSRTDIESAFSTDDQFSYVFASDDGEEEFVGHLPYEEEERLKTEDFISRPYFSPNCDIEENILEFDFSYGYDCKKPYNLVVIDERTIIFASGNLIHIFDVETREIWFRRSALGGGIGHMTKNPNPNFPHLAVGENGHRPPIIIYEWPSLEIICILRGGTSKIYTHLDYSPTGDLLASQGGEPDYLITIWNWPKSSILLRTQCHINDVLRLMFSPFVPGQLTTSGIEHIKFWKIANTFTGLKLLSEPGRFSKTEESNIVGIFPMPDEKVISGCFWGNILVWDEGLIKLEVCRKNRKRCHDDAIVQFKYAHGELWTVSLDGHVKMWYYDTIDQADPPDEDRFLIMEPTYDFHTPGARFMCIEKQFADPYDTFYFAQDAKGAIWRIDLNIEEDATPSVRLLKCHAGVTMGLAVCPWGPYFNTFGIGGWLHLYNYEERRLLVILLFPAPGVDVLWVPLNVDPSGEVIILALGDGTVRVAVWKINKQAESSSQIHVIQIEKSHAKPITCMKLNPTGTLLVTGGEDKTVFVFQVVWKPKNYIRLVPIGYIVTPEVPNCITWHNRNSDVIIIGCIHGEIMSVELPTEPVPYTKITFILEVDPIIQRFHSYKAQIERYKQIKDIARKKQDKRARKQLELKKIRLDNPGLDIDEDIYLQDSESTESLPPLYVPKVPNKIYWIMHTEDDTLWVSMDGYDAGFIYEYKIGQTDPIPFKCQPVYGAENKVVAKYLYSKHREYIIFAMLDGSIRVNRVNRRDWHDLTNYWQLSMHDNYNGFVSGMSFSYDNTYFLTSGHDGNVFAFRFYPDESEESTDSIFFAPIKRQIPDLSTYEFLDNVDCKLWLSLEETIVKAEVDRINKVANENKAIYMEKIQDLRDLFEELLERNEKLPDAQKLTQEELISDRRVVRNLEQTLNADLELLDRKYAFSIEKSKLQMQKLRRHFIDCMDTYPIKVKGINNDEVLYTIKERNLGEEFFLNLERVDKKILENQRKGRPPERAIVAPHRLQTSVVVEKKLEYFLAGLSTYVIENKLGPRIKRLLAKYRARKEWKDNRKQQWEQFNLTKPADLSTDADDAAALKIAQEGIGDYKLKSSPDYKVPKHLRESTYTKYKELLLVRQRGYNLVHDFNRKVYEMREKKRALHEDFNRELKFLTALQEELLPQDRKKLPPLFDFDDEDYPEKQLEINNLIDIEEKEKTKSGNILIERPADLVQRAVVTLRKSDAIEKDKPSEWEKEMHARRYRIKLFEQEQILKSIDQNEQKFNEELSSLRNKRIAVNVDYGLILLHLLTLNQELIVLKECESKEDFLSDKVNQKLQDLMDVQDVFADLRNQIEEHKKEIERQEEEEKEITKNFYVAISDSKFYDFLRRIFRKKYKPPKEHKDDDSSSSSSSSSSEESDDDDAASIDSKDFNIIRLDENVCPKGCDINTYKMTFQLRSQRHQVEQKVKDLQYQIEVATKNKQQIAKKLVRVEKNLQEAQNHLEEYQREKQQKLNKIMCTVVLKADQIRNVTETESDGIGFNYIKDSLLIAHTSLAKLYCRVTELDGEKNQQLEKHRLSVIHLKRMETDFAVMARIILNLRREIKETIVRKFGSPEVDINELEEYMLKKLIFDLKLSMADIRGFFDMELRQLYEKNKAVQKSLIGILRKNTLGQELLSLINYENTQLVKDLDHQQTVKKNLDEAIETAQSMTENVKKLQNIIKEQHNEIEMLKSEIKMYKTKGFRRPSKQIESSFVDTEEVEEEESIVSEFGEIDDYMYTEAYAREFWARKEAEERRKSNQKMILLVMDNLFKNIDVEMRRHTIMDLLKSAFSVVLNQTDVKDIIDEIFDIIPSSSSFNEKQVALIETTAEKLHSVNSEEVFMVTDYEKETEALQARLIQCTDDVLEQSVEDASDFVGKLVHVLIETFPLQALLDSANLDCVVNRIMKKHDVFENTDLYAEIMSSIEEKTMEGHLIMAELTDRIFGKRESDESVTSDHLE